MKNQIKLTDGKTVYIWNGVTESQRIEITKLLSMCQLYELHMDGASRLRCNNPMMFETTVLDSFKDVLGEPISKTPYSMGW